MYLLVCRFTHIRYVGVVGFTYVILVDFLFIVILKKKELSLINKSVCTKGDRRLFISYPKKKQKFFLPITKVTGQEISV